MFISVCVIECDVDGCKILYLNVGFKDDDGCYYLFVDFGQVVVQMFVCKLVNVEVGVFIEIGMFVIYGQCEGVFCVYVDYGVSFKQFGVEIKSVDLKEFLVFWINVVMKVLEDVGVFKDDKEMFVKCCVKVELEFYVELMKKVNDKFIVFYVLMEQFYEVEDDVVVFFKEVV